MISKCLLSLCIVLFFSCENDLKKNVKNSDKSTQKIITQTSKVVQKEKLLSKKEIILNELMGRHKLVSISGFAGANTMIDYFIEKNKWIANGSSIFEGMREPFDIDLNPTTLKKLNSFIIEINTDLSLALKLDGKTYLNVPFIDEGMAYQIHHTKNDYSSYISSSVDSHTTIYDGYLYLYVNDKMSEKTLSNLDIIEVMANAMILKFNLKKKEFELNLFFADCCDASTYIFK